MFTIKKVFSVILALLICLLSVISVSAANRKFSISDYNGKGSLKVREESLYSFDDDSKMNQKADSFYFDTKDKKEGSASYAANLTGSDRKYLFTIDDFGKSVNLKSSENQLITLKMWIYISDASKIKADHEDLYNNDYSNSSTVYFRTTSNGQSNNHCMNPTIWGNGWQEIEIDYSINYGISGNFDITQVTGCFMFVYIKEPVTIKVDDLRICYYSNNGYKADTSDVIEGARIISTCDYDALDGAMVSEWFDTNFSEDIKHSGSSSIHSFSDGSDDQRMYFANNNIPLDRENDYLCFWMYIDNFSNLGGLFIETNQEQDTHEYELLNCLTQIPMLAKTSKLSGNWFMMQIPIKIMEEHLSDKYSDTVTLKALRICASARSGKEVNVYVDSAFIATYEQVLAYNSNHSNEDSDTQSDSLKPSLKDSDTSLTSSDTKNSANGDLFLYIAIIGGAVLVIGALVVVAVIVLKKSKKRG